MVWNGTILKLVLSECKLFASARKSVLRAPARPYYFRKGDWNLRLKDLSRIMNTDLLSPPAQVSGMTELQRDAFRKQVEIPYVRVPESVDINRAMKVLRKYILKLEKLKPISDWVEEAGPEESTIKYKHVYLNPLLVKSLSALPEADRQFITDMDPTLATRHELHLKPVTLTYDNWKAEEILKAVLPSDKEGCTGFSRVGHIIHLNLRDHLVPYRQLIGQVFVDKVKDVRLVVNKANTIDSTFRHFSMDVLAGQKDDTVAEVKENGCHFRFDFARVYWNPRLSTEHERIVKKLGAPQVLYDVCAGIGPFTVPAAKLGRCQVLANDLNPDAVVWLRENVKRNKVDSRVQVFNKDGRSFVREDVRNHLVSLTPSPPDVVCHVTMNLPALAVTFLDAFVGLLADVEPNKVSSTPSIQVHVYAFCPPKENGMPVLRQAESILGCSLEKHVLDLHNVRDVAPNKEMWCLSFTMPLQVLRGETNSEISQPVNSTCTSSHASDPVVLDANDKADSSEQPPCKRMHLEEKK